MDIKMPREMTDEELLREPDDWTYTVAYEVVRLRAENRMLKSELEALRSL